MVKNKYQRGFTLIELSIVLVAIGLLVGGIMAGRSLIRQSQVLSIIVDEQKYVKAAMSFRDKYNALPGDMANATNYWGTNTKGCSAVTIGGAVQTGTCNGNGNGYIDSYDSASAGSMASAETFAAWQQLADAGFITGIYSGMPGSCSWVAVSPGINIPAGRIESSGFEWTYATPSGNGLGYSPSTVNYQQYLWYGRTSCDDVRFSLLTGPEATTIDQKIDDGLPLTGGVLGANSQTDSAYVACLNYSTTPTSYLTDSLPRCTMFFKVTW